MLLVPSLLTSLLVVDDGVPPAATHERLLEKYLLGVQCIVKFWPYKELLGGLVGGPFFPFFRGMSYCRNVNPPRPPSQLKPLIYHTYFRSTLFGACYYFVVKYTPVVGKRLRRSSKSTVSNSKSYQRSVACIFPSYSTSPLQRLLYSSLFRTSHQRPSDCVVYDAVLRRCDQMSG